jgi:hypothetical protein
MRYAADRLDVTTRRWTAPEVSIDGCPPDLWNGQPPRSTDISTSAIYLAPSIYCVSTAGMRDIHVLYKDKEGGREQRTASLHTI